jgi:hypothetical protein
MVETRREEQGGDPDASEGTDATLPKSQSGVQAVLRSTSRLVASR